MICLVPLLAPAQFRELASNEDGSVLYFTSPNRLRGTGHGFDNKIFRIADGGGLTTSQARDRGSQIGFTWTEFYDLGNPQVSTDGSAIAFTAHRPCDSVSSCLNIQRDRGVVMDSTGRELANSYGQVGLSPNRKYALFSGAISSVLGQFPPAELVDLSTGVRVGLPRRLLGSAKRSVADDGTVALPYTSLVATWRGGVEEQFPNSITAGNLMISADATRLVYEGSTGLTVIDRTSASQTVLAPGPVSSPSIDRNARVIAWIDANSRVWIASPTPQLLTAVAEAAVEIGLSGDGRRAFVATKSGRLIRVELARGDVTVLVPRTPLITSPAFNPALVATVASGSMVTLLGNNLTGDRLAVGVQIGGTPAPVIAASPDRILFQVPWEQPEGNFVLDVTSGESPLEPGPGSLVVKPVSPAFLQYRGDDDALVVAAAHGDWSGLVTVASPARRGETIHLYMVGLGPVDQPVATGAISPADPPARITGALECLFFDSARKAADINYAGLAPGLVGLYQVSVTVPVSLGAFPSGPVCEFPDGQGALGKVPVR